MDRNLRTALYAGGLVVTMGGLSFAAVPFYDWFCRVTGFGGTTAVSDGSNAVPTDQWVTVRFVAATERGMPWTFRPVETSMRVRVGESALAFYEASNPTDVPVAGQASYNVMPYAAGGYFAKVECFCFTEQVLQPGETVQMPVSFYVDPAILQDPDGRFVREITLGYTFYQMPLPPEEETHAALAGAVQGL
ncbi:cytochrome c oxidase assembly protein [Rubellimicrobium sp. CFH 75288]|uniref:cytochrome c oxidase assembly protein n=1 Tax=Rubellimicrobium sp. CFH 75288 TaxID=2697034 RepID=UPI001411BD04|nr:cytochrome c oxidase assembly protein [Rubellimicrobium sp. CFH 75288]NAZ35605.1 cytochrome c oxidase assembly protein [Rubellimicrobium sp. CFH 75288]